MCNNRCLPSKPNCSPSEPGKLRGSGDNTCPTCASPVADGARFCGQCGCLLAVRQAPEPAAYAGPAAVVPHEPAPSVAPPEDDPPFQVPPAGVRPTPPDTTCTCGKSLPWDAQFCLRCGARVGQPRVRFQLSRMGPGHQVASVPMSGDELTIGKSGEEGMVIADDDYVSRRHARLFQSDGLLFLEDLGSSNGTFLRVRRPIVVQSGDEIVIGTCSLRLEEVGGVPRRYRQHSEARATGTGFSSFAT